MKFQRVEKFLMHGTKHILYKKVDFYIFMKYQDFNKNEWKIFIQGEEKTNEYQSDVQKLVKKFNLMDYDIVN